MNKALEGIEILACAIKNEPSLSLEEKKEDEEFLMDCIRALPRYFNSVIVMETSMVIVSQLYEGEEYRDRVQKMDEDRRRNHISMVDAINKINRLAKFYDLEPVFKTGLERELIPDANGWNHDPAANRKAAEDRTLAAGIAYEFCRDILLDSCFKQYQNPNMDKELYDIGKNSGHFHENFLLDELIERARGNEDLDSKEESSKSIENENLEK